MPKLVIRETLTPPLYFKRLNLVVSDDSSIYMMVVTTLSRTPRTTLLAIYGFKVQFLISGIMSSVHIDISLINFAVKCSVCQTFWSQQMFCLSLFRRIIVRHFSDHTFAV